MAEKIFILGGKGMFAGAFKAFAPAWAELSFFDKDVCDITVRENVKSLLENGKPSAVINTAAVLDEIYAEAHPGEAFKVNMVAAIYVAEECNRLGIKCIHIDTCFSRNPVNQYAFSKYAAFRYIESEFPETYIARVGWLFGSASPAQFDGLILNALKSGRQLKLATCHMGSPTYMKDAVELIFNRIKQGAFGLEEVANLGFCNRYEFGMELARAFGFEEEAKKIFSAVDTFPEKVPKPADARIDGKMRDWKIAVHEFGTTSG